MIRERFKRKRTGKVVLTTIQGVTHRYRDKVSNTKNILLFRNEYNINRKIYKNIY